jgi:hypothetical protein
MEVICIFLNANKKEKTCQLKLFLLEMLHLKSAG